ncbi:inositol monophosphatase family protein [Pseudogemmobacter sonorensis]|uniref:inositol monophosphatase family protein n=1 Tax=Pseudogemmobacter sonorensis TaxID=2989681 RepID=UPI00367D8AAD
MPAQGAASPETPAVVDDALRLSLVALLAALGREVLAAKADVSAKGSDGLDLVTSVDLAIQSRLETALPALLPGSSVTGEEGYAALAAPPDLVWLVDPLDGTVNFVAGLPIYAIAVVLLAQGVPVLAAVQDVPRGLCYSARKGGGAFTGASPLRRHDTPARLCAISSGLIRNLARNAPATLDALMGEWKLRNLGSQALQLCHAAEGHLRFVASHEARAWDDFAGALIATEAGLRYGRYLPGPAPAADAPQSSLCAEPDLFDAIARGLARSPGTGETE